MKQNELLSGNIWKNLITLTCPLLMGNILQQFYNAMDTWMIGKWIGEHAFAAAGIAGTFMNLFIFLLHGFCVGSSVLFSQQYGSGNLKKMRQQVFTALMEGFGVTLILVIIFGAGMPVFLKLLRTPAELFSYTKQYLMVILFGLPVTWFYNFYSNLLCSVGNTRQYLIFLSVSVVFNMILDYIILAVLHQGIGSAALATVLAQLAAGLLCLRYLKKFYPDILFTRADMKWEKKVVIHTLKFGCVSAMHQSSIHIGRILVQGTVNTLGVAGIAGYTAAMRIEGFLKSFGTSGAQSLTVFISQNYGAGKKKRVHEIFRKGMCFMIIMAAIVSVSLHFFSKEAVGFFILPEQTDAFVQGIEYINMITFFYLFDYMGSAFVGNLRGTGRITVPFMGTTFHITIRVILAMLLVPKMGILGVAVATGIGWICVNVADGILELKDR